MDDSERLKRQIPNVGSGKDEVRDFGTDSCHFFRFFGVSDTVVFGCFFAHSFDTYLPVIAERCFSPCVAIHSLLRRHKLSLSYQSTRAEFKSFRYMWGIEPHTGLQAA